MTNRIYVQSEFFTDTKLIQVEDGASIEDLKKASLELLPPEAHEMEINLFAEDDDDEHEDGKKVEHLKTPHGTRVHLHRCKNIDVTVRFAGQTIDHKFRPSTTIGRIRLWAGKKLGMQPDDIAEHVLQVVGSNEQPDVDVHVGTLTNHPSCSVELDLVPSHRING